ncbi:MAG: UDP-N-acetylmuramoyl-tripeptide--D-alanyl-D-alanine ligase [Bacteroidales bacterium]|nr:UDP-N-acetylmuramoyl-tripeptide--D-alanyl-D-alanine ligase [Bacteroidales bacterium]
MADIRTAFEHCGAVTTDTRNINPGAMFVALKGERFDGNDYALDALQSGAAYAVVAYDSKLGRALSEGGDASLEAVRERIVLVPDTLEALQGLARWHRRKFHIPVIGLTGTNGKTTTKELITAVLSKKYRVCATKGNLNNHIGVPMTLLGMGPETEIAVIEMGANHPGEIKTLVEIALPNAGLVTNVGKAHLEGFGSFEGVKATKRELYDFLASHQGVVLFNEDNAHLAGMLDEAAVDPQFRMPYGLKLFKGELLPVSLEEPYLRLNIFGKTLKTALVGDYNADNVVAALAVAMFFEVDLEDAMDAIAAYRPSNHRSQMVRTERNTLVVDAYNANPTSMNISTSAFASNGLPGKVMILGALRELGAESVAEHKALIEHLKSLKGVEQVFLVGQEFEGLNESFPLFADVEALKEHLKAFPLEGKSILLKGSHSTSLERLIEIL